MRPEQPKTQKYPRRIGAATRQQVLIEAGFHCANPICRSILTLELHHIDWVKDGGGNRLENLIALCPNCHSLHTKGHIPREAIEVWKSILTSINNPHRSSADVLLVLFEEDQRIASAPDPSAVPGPFSFTGDGLGVLAGLMTSGLVTITRRRSGGSAWGGGTPYFNVGLTDSGRLVVKAWRTGRADHLRAALARRHK